MNDFRNDEALMCAGLDEWFRGPPEVNLKIREERLGARLGCEFFIKPPDFSDAEGGPRYKVPHLRFPTWHYCPRCFRMSKTTLFGAQPRCTEEKCVAKGRGRRMIPVRIVAVCENGHIEDFPFRAWIGCQCADESACRLYFKAGRSSASLAGIRIECRACGKRRTLARAFVDGVLGTLGVSCCGAQPWLGLEKGRASCPAPLKTVQRGGANVYFPAVQSSIYIPPARLAESEDIRRVLDNPGTWHAISSGLVNGKVNEVVCRAFAMQAGVDPSALLLSAQARIDAEDRPPRSGSEEEYRRQEYDVLCSGSGTESDELFVELAEGARYGWLGSYISRIGLVRKLRETRVLTGFSRLVPRVDRGDPAVQPLSTSRSLGWLPAVEVRGEGIFIEFASEALKRWLGTSCAEERVRNLADEYNRRRIARRLAPRNLDARFIMVHTFAHVLMKELTFSCGYGSASLRERLYCSLEGGDMAMTGILIYTASGDSEGTLGGLVAQAASGRFERLVEDALQRNRWCSNDPVCIESPGDQALSSNLAACHGCVLMPETSCEEGNRLLDRGVLVGTIAEPGLGYFSQALHPRG